MPLDCERGAPAAQKAAARTMAGGPNGAGEVLVPDCAKITQPTSACTPPVSPGRMRFPASAAARSCRTQI